MRQRECMARLCAPSRLFYRSGPLPDLMCCQCQDPDKSAPVCASCRLQQLERCVEASTAEAASLHEGLAGVAEYRAALDVASQQVWGRWLAGWKATKQRATGCGRAVWGRITRFGA